MLRILISVLHKIYPNVFAEIKAQTGSKISRTNKVPNEEHLLAAYLVIIRPIREMVQLWTQECDNSTEIHEKRYSSEGKSSSAGQEMPRTAWNLESHYRV